MRTSIYLITISLLSPNLLKGQDWTQIKTGIAPKIELINEFDSVYRQPLSSIGWEDGIHISSNGLHLYCTYVPIDILAFSLNSELPDDFSMNYLRGAPDYGMDLTTSPTGSTEWLHSDILYASRATTSDVFEHWELSNMARPIYSEGAPSTVDGPESMGVEYMLFTSIDNPTNNMDIWMIRNTTHNPTGIGEPLPFPVNTLEKEDNPNLIKTAEGTLVLFYDSDKTGSLGDLDLWYSISNDDGTSWSMPENVSSVNTSAQEHQPFLFFDTQKGGYYLYYSTSHADGKLAIFRRKQLSNNDWNSWSTAELVISAGNSAGIGEPTLTKSGDISFVVVYEDPEQTSMYNRFDADAWLLRRRQTILDVAKNQFPPNDIMIYPNPTTKHIHINESIDLELIRIIDNKGALLYVGDEHKITVDQLSKGLHYLSIRTRSGKEIKKKIIIE